MSGERADEAFALAYESFEPDEEGLREALTSTGNGYFCTRGAAEWEDAGGAHYPGRYAHGGYNRETTVMRGRPVLNEDLVNLPNWLVLKLRIEGELYFGRRVLLVGVRHDLAQGDNLAHGCQLLFPGQCASPLRVELRR